MLQVRTGSLCCNFAEYCRKDPLLCISLVPIPPPISCKPPSPLAPFSLMILNAKVGTEWSHPYEISKKTSVRLAIFWSVIFVGKGPYFQLGQLSIIQGKVGFA